MVQYIICLTESDLGKIEEKSLYKNAIKQFPPPEFQHLRTYDGALLLYTNHLLVKPINYTIHRLSCLENRRRRV